LLTTVLLFSLPLTTIFGQSITLLPFKIKIVVYHYPLLDSTTIVLTEKSLRISSTSDATIFSGSLKKSEGLVKISGIHFMNLKSYYSNSCIDDGLGLHIIIEKDRFKKQISLDNYYQNDIGRIINFVNTYLSKSNKIWYDKKKLIKDYQDCKQRITN
jgi:hypothetical protein